ncbi:hypothetical protein AKJ62_00925 [candidate division MSBL1 archaeon SCGC-AAA259D14]|uniref:Cation:proton antiporter n=2 Tax=candidate division MSBL1 TaxID=215777 RepID=A0A133U880_9EURY|nr:hypothetical protein AKJ62_00925 [candidate division MSBL1 archaeon SCGC-AAA259D14]KXA93376.1 hypothetical protein AKJ66_02135 [candidate division MSBL1 archaeon SCGC-AAA259E22]
MSVKRNEEERLAKWEKIVITWVILFLFWIIISSRLGWQSLFVGALVTLGVSFVMYNMITGDIRSHAGRTLAQRVLRIGFFYIPEYVALMIFKLAKSNFTVIKHVILMDIDPGIIKIRSDIDSYTGITVLANSITLNPGTLTLDVNKKPGENNLYVHWIDFFTVERTRVSKRAKGLKEWLLLEREKARERIKGGLEESLKKIFW